jgi:hypothetical protein
MTFEYSVKNSSISLGVRQFGDFSRIKLEPPPSLRSLLEIAVEADETTVKSQLSKTEIVDVRCSFLQKCYSNPDSHHSE